MQEVWKDIPSFEGFYQVSNFGRIKCLSRKVANRNGCRIVSEKIKDLKRIDGNYLTVGLFKNNKSSTFYIHRLVAELFLKNPENKKTVNHKNGNRQDNSVSNLEWATYSENIKHSFEKLGRVSKMKGMFDGLNPNSKFVEVYHNGVFYKKYDSLKKASSEIGVSVSLISTYLKSGKTTLKGYHFK